MDPVSTLNRLVDRLYERQSEVTKLNNAYEGKHRLHYTSSNFEEFFARRYEKFSDNWCGIVADAPHERIEPTGLQIHLRGIGVLRTRGPVGVTGCVAGGHVEQHCGVPDSRRQGMVRGDR